MTGMSECTSFSINLMLKGFHMRLKSRKVSACMCMAGEAAMMCGQWLGSPHPTSFAKPTSDLLITGRSLSSFLVGVRTPQLSSEEYAADEHVLSAMQEDANECIPARLSVCDVGSSNGILALPSNILSLGSYLTPQRSSPGLSL